MALTAPITLTLPGPSPDRSDRATFSARSVARDEFIKNVEIPERQATLNAVYNNAGEAFTSATAAAASASTSSVSASDAATSAAAALAATGAPAWVSGNSYTLGFVVWSPVTKQLYRRIVAGAGTTDPSADATNWFAITAPKEQLLTDAATTQWNLDLGASARWIINATGRALNITNPQAGVNYVLRVKLTTPATMQFTYPANWVWQFGTAPDMSASSSTLFSLVWIPEDSKFWVMVGLGF
jgi:hypothetical protein